MAFTVPGLKRGLPFKQLAAVCHASASLRDLRRADADLQALQRLTTSTAASSSVGESTLAGGVLVGEPLVGLARTRPLNAPGRSFTEPRPHPGPQPPPTPPVPQQAAQQTNARPSAAVVVFAATERGPWGAAWPRLSAYEATSGSNGSLDLCISAAPAYDGPTGNRREVLRRSGSEDISDSSRSDNYGGGGVNDDEYGLGKAYSDVETTACPPRQGAPLSQVGSHSLQGANQRPPLPRLILYSRVAYCFNLGFIFLN